MQNLLTPREFGLWNAQALDCASLKSVVVMDGHVPVSYAGSHSTFSFLDWVPSVLWLGLPLFLLDVLCMCLVSVDEKNSCALVFAKIHKIFSILLSFKNTLKYFSCQNSYF